MIVYVSIYIDNGKYWIMGGVSFSCHVVLCGYKQEHLHKKKQKRMLCVVVYCDNILCYNRKYNTRINGNLLEMKKREKANYLQIKECHKEL